MESVKATRRKIEKVNIPIIFASKAFGFILLVLPSGKADWGNVYCCFWCSTAVFQWIIVSVAQSQYCTERPVRSSEESNRWDILAPSSQFSVFQSQPSVKHCTAIIIFHLLRRQLPYVLCKEESKLRTESYVAFAKANWMNQSFYY